MIPIGSMVAGYRVRRIVGSGGMGTIYAVDDPQLPRLDALKVLSAELSADTKFRARFIREADVASGLDHPNIVSIYDRGETPEGQLWIAMQLVDGTDADAAIRAGTMTPHRAVHVITAVAEALDYAHAHHVLHRDVKPANFLLTGPVGDDERVLLGDFGIARAVDDAGLTGTNMVMATMSYAAPEVLSGQQVDHRADLYSLGCALFHLLTGQVPYADTTGASAQAIAHLQRPPPKLTPLAPGLPPAFDTVIATAMAKDPGDRYQSGRALAAAANDALRQRDHTTHPAIPSRGDLHSASTVPRSPSAGGAAARRGRRATVLGAGAAVTVLAAAGITAAVLTKANNDTPEPPPSTSAAPTSTLPTVAASELSTLMVTADRISAATGVPAMAQAEPWTSFASDSFDSCGGVVYPFQKKTYSGSGSTDEYAQIFTEVGSDSKVSAIQSVVAFPSADLATRFVDRQRALWPPCAYKSVRVSASGSNPAYHWLLGAVNTGDIMTTAATKDDTNRTCQHALTSANNIVVDVMACSETKPDAAQTIAQAIVDRIAQ
ncbi:sensor domain-containing protein [Mycolicibacillus parakoreensis]|uniref:non-specific serine/threonine protein kinase n=1 Tax=Mycolicibacillus parakoreensis TaxID=1069221 RepID=A0ABY3U1G3_9MYCO|nr:serine/threonine-protein kinase PknH/PknJ [Mycolicibacillus parakoreensis]MCV7314301.1 sensor domain-containing protein [Mycolicibacillus parakoreensis]ULN53342.1 serine/threonine-protein kinase PknH/PknJ [Mycolicibacillus parakoreensis]